MTFEECQALREKHFLWKERECNYDGDPYPCDAIKTHTDAYEKLSNRMSFIEENLSGNTIVNVSKNLN